ncbi:MAG TPA: hypothetical protein VIS48_05500 [Candidatus Kryptonia bacterium]
MKKLFLIATAVALALGVAYVVTKAVEEMQFEDEDDELTSEDIEAQLLEHE